MKPLGSLLAACLLALHTSTSPAETLHLPPDGDNLVGHEAIVQTRAEDTLLDIARRYDFGYNAIQLANQGVDPWLPGDGTEVVLPGRHILPATPREGIVINLPEMRLYYYPPRRNGGPPTRVMTFPIGIGKQGWLAPDLLTRVSAKQRHPIWYVPESIRREHAEDGDALPAVVPAGKDNPLGDYALRLGDSQYLIHGTNKKYGAGMRVSHGCFRLNPADIRQLFKRVAVGTPVRIVNQRFKVGISAGRLYLEAYPPLHELRHAASLADMVRLVVHATGGEGYVVDWDRAAEVAHQARGIPVEIGQARPGNPE